MFYILVCFLCGLVFQSSHLFFVFQPPITFIALMHIPYYTYVRIVSILDITENFLQMEAGEAILQKCQITMV
jgi:hypothetical protein